MGDISVLLPRIKWGYGSLVLHPANFYFPLFYPYYWSSLVKSSICFLYFSGLSLICLQFSLLQYRLYFCMNYIYYFTDLSITHTFPCRNTKTDRDQADRIEAEIAHTIEKEQLTLVGWYHSHPTSPATPTLRDIDAQLDYQIKMKGSSDSSYTPCVGIICCKLNVS